MTDRSRKNEERRGIPAALFFRTAGIHPSLMHLFIGRFGSSRLVELFRDDRPDRVGFLRAIGGVLLDLFDQLTRPLDLPGREQRRGIARHFLVCQLGELLPREAVRQMPRGCLLDVTIRSRRILFQQLQQHGIGRYGLSPDQLIFQGRVRFTTPVVQADRVQGDLHGLFRRDREETEAVLPVVSREPRSAARERIVPGWSRIAAHGLCQTILAVLTIVQTAGLIADQVVAGIQADLRENMDSDESLGNAGALFHRP